MYSRHACISSELFLAGAESLGPRLNGTRTVDSNDLGFGEEEDDADEDEDEVEAEEGDEEEEWVRSNACSASQSPSSTNEIARLATPAAFELE